MPYLRWLHKSWNVIWTFIGVLSLTVALIFGIMFGMLQLQPVKNQVADMIESRFSQNFQGVLHIGKLEGLIPMELNMSNVKIYADSASFDPVLEAQNISAGLDVWSMFRNKIVVKSIQVDVPKGIIDRNSDQSLDKAFIRPFDAVSNSTELKRDGVAGFELIIPTVIIENGNLILRNINSRTRPQKLHSLTIQDINMDMFVEFTDNQRFIDMNRVTFNAPDADLNNVEIFGQIYNDDQFLELNAMTLIVGNSKGRFSGEADGVNLLMGNIKEQLDNATLDFTLDQLSIEPEYLKTIGLNIPAGEANLTGTIQGEGTLDSLYFNEADLGIGDSYLSLTGQVTHIRDINKLKYVVDVDALILGKKEIDAFKTAFNTEQIDAIANARLEGDLQGDIRTVNGNLTVSSNRGTAGVKGQVAWGNEVAVDLIFSTDSLNLGYLIDPRIQSTDLTLNGEFRSTSLDVRKAKGALTITSGAGVMDNRNYEQLSIVANWENGLIEPQVSAIINGSEFSSDGTINLSTNVPAFQLRGAANKINVNQIIQDNRMQSIVSDFEYDINLKGSKLNELHGQVSLDVIQAIAGNDTLNRHQLYFDINDPNSQNRVLRLTTTAFDATVEGNFEPENLLALGSHWQDYFSDHIKKELFFDSSIKTQKIDTLKITKNQDVTITGRLKNLGLIKSYYPNFPMVSSSARLNSTLNLNSQRLLFNATLLDNRSKIDDFQADSVMLQLTGGFRYESDLKAFSGLQMQLNAAEFVHPLLIGKELDVFTDVTQDSIQLRASINELAEAASFEFYGNGSLTNDALTLFIQKFELGSDSYKWINRSIPIIKYGSNEKLTMQDFVFDSDDQFIQVNGTYSNSSEDSVYYNIGNVELSKISQILGGRLTFGGKLDGEFTSKTLTSVPTVQGDVAVEAFDIDDRLVGDIILSSRYNSSLNRFDTNVTVRTDSSKYPEYYANNERRGQNFDINGYVLAPENGKFPAVDSLYNFNITFDNIDLWILPYVGPKIFKEGAGLANGSAKIWGDKETYDFNADFMVGVDDAAYLGPRFLDTYYYAQGSLNFTRDEGLTFNDIFLIDPSGGSAILSGYYDFNDFSKLQYMNIRMEMDEFQFLNSSFDPTAAFYGKAFGSSTVTISGTNQNPILRTEEPVIISDFSEISIPLLEETEFNESNRFIRFVNSFDELEDESGQLSGNMNGGSNSTQTAPENLTFAERFTLDLQFEANNPMTVQLIFDPVTGDIVTTEGTGRIRILLEDEQVSMFGRFDIQGGRYQFVSGDIFTRRLELEPGGTIIWEGDPGNARLNLNAVYSARPDINTLSNNGTRDPENSQRVPVDLVLNIGGTISSIVNDFYFRLPNTIETQQNSTLTTQLASINRDNDLKLIQAANFMLMGDFIPVSATGEAQANLFGDNLSGSSAVLNPLLSSQIINPLLSNQVNSLLNSDLSSLDVDFNLNTYNQVDLGVALRLYNDKLILRREGQITGRQSNIGDLGATYRINRTFALTAFHRQDLTFGTVSSTEQSQQSQDINGLGLEAKVSFNTWDEFFNRLFSPFRKIFGSNEKDEDQEAVTDNKQGQSPN